jgi:hypothetical protein
MKALQIPTLKIPSVITAGALALLCSTLSMVGCESPDNPVKQSSLATEPSAPVAPKPWHQRTDLEAHTSRCDQKTLDDLHSTLERTAPNNMLPLIATGTAQACAEAMPEALKTWLERAGKLDDGPPPAPQTISGFGPLLEAACPQGVEALRDQPGVTWSDRLGAIYDRCQFARLDLASREEFVRSTGPDTAVVAATVFVWLVNDGVPLSLARKVSRQLGNFAEPNPEPRALAGDIAYWKPSLTLTGSVARLQPQSATTLVVSREGVWVQGARVLGPDQLTQVDDDWLDGARKTLQARIQEVFTADKDKLRARREASRAKHPESPPLRKWRRGDLFLTALGGAETFWAGRATVDLHLLVEPTVPYDLVWKVMHTAHSVGYWAFKLVVADQSGLTASGTRIAASEWQSLKVINVGVSGLDLNLGSPPTGDKKKDLLAPFATDRHTPIMRAFTNPLIVHVGDNGHRLAIGRTKIAPRPGCTGVETVCLANPSAKTPLGRYGWLDLYRVALEIKDKHPNETAVEITAAPTVPFAVVVKTMDLLRTRLVTPSGEPATTLDAARPMTVPKDGSGLEPLLFPDVVLGPSR